MENQSTNSVTRRDFLKGAAIAAGSAAALGLAGCDADDSGTPATGSGGNSALPATWDQTVEIVVVGTGVGLATAIEAKEAGADVIILEKNDFPGGLYITAGGNSIWGGTKIQKQFGIEDTKEAWWEDEMYACHFRGEVELIKTYYDRADETIEWFEDLGMVWATAGNHQSPETHRVNRTHFPAKSDNYPDSGGGHAYTTVMLRRCEALGIPILYKNRMTKVWRDGDGPVVGVEVQTEDGVINIKATKAVVLCTGTWTDNERLCAQYDPRIVGEDCYGDGGIPADGTLLVDSSADGHIVAAQLGAAFSDMTFVSYLYIFYGARSYWGWEPADFDVYSYKQSGRGVRTNADFFNRVILVNNDGKRYIDESLGSPTELSWEENRKQAVPYSSSYSENPEWPYTQKYLMLDQPRNVWAVADAATAAALKWPMDEIMDPNPKTGIMLDPACIAVADSLSELAAKMGVDASAFASTVADYNGYVDTGVDEEFGKTGLTAKIETGPYYGLKASLIRHTQRNGVRVNTKSQVISLLQPDDAMVPPKSVDDEAVIPHLYAAGELGNIMGWRRPHGSMGNYTIFARIAGENAVLETAID